MSAQHRFEIRTSWTGNTGTGTSGYKAYSRNHRLSSEGKQSTIEGSSDPVFRGDGTRYSPEELLVGSLSACHMLWMLHLCAEAGIVVTSYTDHAAGTMVVNPDGSGQFTEVILSPDIAIADHSRALEVEELNHRAHELCFIARSVNFEVHVSPRITHGILSV